MSGISYESAERYGTLAAVLLTSIVAQFNAVHAKRTAKRVAKDLVATSVSVSDRLNESDKRKDDALRQIHSLVNGSMGNVLHKVWDLSARIAATTQKPEDLDAAARAKDEYETHMERQRLVDQKLREAQWNDLSKPNPQNPSAS